MKIRTGIDLVEDKRMEENLGNKDFLLKVFHPSELRYAQQNARSKKEHAKKLAGIFSLKEAAAKAFNLTPPPWLEIEIKYISWGKPKIELSNLLKKKLKKKILSHDCSSSHAKGLTTGIRIILVK